MEDRKLTKDEKLGILSAVIMFFSIGAIMGGSSKGNTFVSTTGGITFAIGAIIAIYLIVKNKDKDEDDDLFME